MKEETIRRVIFCIDKGEVVAHAVETETMVIGTRIGATHKTKHEVAKDIQELFNISPIQHLRLLQEKGMFVNTAQYQEIMDNCRMTEWDEAEKRVKGIT